MFNTQVVCQAEYSLDGMRIRALKLMMPQQMFELQRRVFYRTPISDCYEIDVEVWKDGEAGSSPHFRGRLVDLSAGGLSFELDSAEPPTWEHNATLCCSLVCASPEVLIEASTLYRHCAKSETGGYRIGLQFAGLEASDEGRATIQRILDLTSHLQRA